MGLAWARGRGYVDAMLNRIFHGAPTDRPPLVIAHGLYGSGRNWGVIARRLSDERQVIAVDMRNHGASPWSDRHGYEEMAADLAEVIEAAGGQADVVGHSMGGKAAMALALLYPDLVRRLVVADIAPVTYTHTQLPYIQAMRAVDLDRVERRSDAEAMLAEQGVERALQSFFTQSLDVANRRWRLNLDTLETEMARIMSFPELGRRWDGPALFLAGAESGYVRPEHRDAIRALFPKARFARIPGAGHWLHAERPREFEAAVRAFLNADPAEENGPAGGQARGA
ncbi:alpha/beta fold hydrolase [Jhaorihella thermophila]